MSGSHAARLIERVSRRRWLSKVGSNFRAFTIAACAVFAALLCTSRLLALIPDRFALVTVLAPPLAGFLLALLVTRRPSARAAARFVDSALETHDLFLTRVLLDQAIGGFKPLVVSDSEDAAIRAVPARIAPFRPARALRDVALCLLLLLAGILWLPQLDPFKRQAERAKMTERQQALESTRKATAKRAEILKQRASKAALSEETQKLMAELKDTLDGLKPIESKANLDALKLRQKDLADLWRKRSEERLRDAFERTPSAQQFGNRPPQTAQWKEEIQRGTTDAMKQEMEALQKLAEQLAKTSDRVEKEKLREEIKDRTKALADFAARDLNSKAMNAALTRALEQLAAAANPQLTPEALEALKESLNLADLELETIARNVRDLKAVEEALKTIQMAKQLNAMNQLPGDPGQGAQGLEGYAALYAKLMAEMQEGEAEGGAFGDKGRGSGGVAPEDETTLTDFHDEKSKSALVAGKTLLEITTREVSASGEARERYLQNIERVRQGAGEALLKEQVPPGYHEAIRQYFNAMKDHGTPTAAKP